MVLTESVIRKVVLEELTKGEVSSMIAAKIGDNMDSREFKKKVKELASDVVNEIFKILWQRNSFWKTASTN